MTDTDYYPEAEEDFYFETETDEEEYFESFLQSETENEEEDEIEEQTVETTENQPEISKQKGKQGRSVFETALNVSLVVVRRDLNEYTEPNGQCRLLLVSLLDNFCSLYDRNPAKNQKLFSLLCRKLYSMGILKSLDFMEESRALRSIYKEAFKAIVLDAVKSAEISLVDNMSSSSSVTTSPTKSLKCFSSSNSISASSQRANSLSTLFLNTEPSSIVSAEQETSGASVLSAEDLLMTSHSRYREDFIEGRVLGRGGYGKVVVAENILDGTSYAVKKIQFAGLSSQRYIRILREVKSLARLDHVNIVRYHSAWMEDHAVILELVEEESSPTPNIVTNKHSRSKSTPLLTTTVHSTTHGHSNSLYHLQDRKIMYIQMEMCLFTLDYYLKQRNAFFHVISGEARKLGRLPLGRELVLRDKTDRTLTLPAEQLFYWSPEDRKLHLRAGELDRIFKGIVKGLHYIHEHGMIHRDLKPMNIFFQLAEEDELLPKIGDFGLVSEKENVLPSIASSSSPSASENELEIDFAEISLNPTLKTKGIGTATYAAPEQLNQQDYTQKSDIYSLGIICFELFHPCATQMERVRMLDDLKRLHRFPDEFLTQWPKEAAFIWSCIARDSGLRPSTKEILESEWLDRDAEETMSALANENRMLRALLKDREEEIKILSEKLAKLCEVEKE